MIESLKKFFLNPAQEISNLFSNRIDNKKTKKEIFPDFYSVQKLIAELNKDGFFANLQVLEDIEKFGLEDAVLSYDGSCGMRISVYENGVPRIALYDGLKNKEHPLHHLAVIKYQNRIIYFPKS